MPHSLSPSPLAPLAPLVFALSTRSARPTRSYRPFEYVGAPDATVVFAVLGAEAVTVEESVRALPAGTKVGVLKVRLYRPWGAAQFLDALPATVETIAVLERTDDAARQGQGAGAGGPLYQDILATTEDRRKGTHVIAPSVGGDDLTPVHVKSLVNALFAGARSAEVLSFTMAAAAAAAAAASSSSTGAAARPFQAVPADTTQVVVWGSGAVGSEAMANDVLCNLRKTRRLQVQGRTAHDTVESEVAVTNHHLRFASESINAPYVVQPSTADLVAVFDTSVLAAFNVLSSVARKGAVVLNCDWLKEASAADAAGAQSKRPKWVERSPVTSKNGA